MTRIVRRILGRHRWMLRAGGVFVALLGLVAVALAFTFTTLDPPGSLTTAALGINSHDEIVGYFTDDTGTHSFLRSKSGGYTPFDDGSNLVTIANGINKKGHIVGYFSPDGHGYHGFLAVP